MKKTKITSLNTGESHYRNINDDFDDGEIFISCILHCGNELIQGKDGRIYFPITQEAR
jgi:hypothetical protein